MRALDKGLKTAFASLQPVLFAWTRSQAHHDKIQDAQHNNAGSDDVGFCFQRYCQTSGIAQHLGRDGGLPNQASTAHQSAEPTTVMMLKVVKFIRMMPAG